MATVNGDMAENDRDDFEVGVEPRPAPMRNFDSLAYSLTHGPSRLGYGLPVRSIRVVSSSSSPPDESVRLADLQPYALPGAVADLGSR
jgi:hypothetical protein